jgi:hypothetical protein
VRRNFYIPDEVQEAIRAHLRDAVAAARDEFFSSSEDEDSLTGHLGALLMTRGTQAVYAETNAEIPGVWRWRITYNKFRGRGPGATERFVGADGIIELSLDWGGDQPQSKTMLFQAKIGDDDRQGLTAQALKLSTWREAAAIFKYGVDAFSGYTVDEVLAAGGALRADRGRDLDSYLSDLFVPCHVGDDELQYDARRRLLSWRTLDQELVSARFALNHRIRMQVQPPAPQARHVDREIPPEAIHEHRMRATPEEMIRPVGPPPRRVPALETAQRKAQRLFHPDVYDSLDATVKSIATRRFQEVQNAADEIKVEQRRREKASRARQPRRPTDGPGTKRL